MVSANNPCNLGIGMPDFDAYPKSIIDALNDITVNGDYSLHQYSRGPVYSFASSYTHFDFNQGHPRLVNVLAKLYSMLLNQDVKPYDDVLVTLGAYEAIYVSVFGLINPGDEVIIIEPHYDCYVPIVRVAGGVPVFTALRREQNNGNSQWKLDFEELESKFTDKTRLIIVNTPHNPLGKV